MDATEASTGCAERSRASKRCRRVAVPKILRDVASAPARNRIARMSDFAREPLGACRHHSRHERSQERAHTIVADFSQLCRSRAAHYGVEKMVLQPCCDAAIRFWWAGRNLRTSRREVPSELFHRRYKPVNGHKFVAGSSQFCPPPRAVHRPEIS